MKLRISGIVPESVVDGEGFRLTVFVQGCSHHCKGCHNPQTWDYDGGRLVDVSDIVSALAGDPLLQGITFSGGEPFDQPEALCELADAARGLGKDIWSWTGYTYEELLRDDKKRALLTKLDVLVDGPFILEERDLSLLFRGSRNQRIIDVQKSLGSGVVCLRKEVE